MLNRFYNIAGDNCIQLAPWELIKRGLCRDSAIFLSQQDLRFRSDIAGGNINVPMEFLSDLASIPKIAWGFFMSPTNPHISLGAWVHDWLYGNMGKVAVESATFLSGVALSRKQCDQILCFEAMPELGANKFQQYMVYLALRLFGFRAFNDAPPNIRYNFVHLSKAPTSSRCCPNESGSCAAKGCKS